MTIHLSQTTLYKQDYYQWLEATVKFLRERQFNQLDLENLIEEIESMGRSERREIKSRLVVLLMHLLKWKYQPSKRSESWLATINEQRRQINFCLEDSPSLVSYYQEVFESCYTMARKDASKETGLAINTFPDKSPFTQDDVISHDSSLP